MTLSNGSPVFAAMWSSGTHEGLAQTARLEAEPALALLLLRSIYGLQLSVSLQQLPGLWMLADMYQVSGWVGAGRAAVTAPGGCWLLRCCVAAAPHPAASMHCMQARMRRMKAWSPRHSASSTSPPPLTLTTRRWMVWHAPSRTG